MNSVPSVGKLKANINNMFGEREQKKEVLEYVRARDVFNAWGKLGGGDLTRDDVENLRQIGIDLIKVPMLGHKTRYNAEINRFDLFTNF